MRSVWVGAALTLVVACSTFGSTESGAPGPGAGDAGADGPETITGSPPADSFFLAASPLLIAPGGKATLNVALTRGSLVTDAVTIVVKGLPVGLSAQSPVMLVSSAGQIEFDASPTIAIGATAITLEATSASSTTPVTLVVDVLVPGASGDVDPTWVVAGLAGFPGALGVAGDRTFYAASACAGASHTACVAHFSANGDLDQSFGQVGVSQFPLREPTHVVVQPDLNVLVAGNSNASVAWVTRLTTTGGLDTTFASGGTLLVDSTTAVDDLALLPNGDLFVAYGESYISRFDHKGAPVSSFGGGKVTTSNGITQGIALRSAGSPPPLAVLSQDGSQDLLFVEVASDTGVATPGNSLASPKSVPIPGISFDRAPAGVASMPNGSIVAPFLGTGGLYLLELQASGAPADGFGTNGVAGPFTVADGDLGTPTGITVQNDGKILVALADGSLHRFTADAVVDPTFGAGSGIAGIGAPSSGATWLQRVVLQNPGRIVVTYLTASGDTQLVAYWQ